jgi:hypothetical protein
MLSIDFIHRFISSFVFTATIETLAVFLIIWVLLRRRDIKAGIVVFTGVLASFATIPYVWFVFPYMVTWTRAESFWYSEPFVFLIEAVIYRVYLKTNMQTALGISFIANALSYFIGPILRNHGLWFYW